MKTTATKKVAAHEDQEEYLHEFYSNNDFMSDEDYLPYENLCSNVRNGKHKDDNRKLRKKIRSRKTGYSACANVSGNATMEEAKTKNELYQDKKGRLEGQTVRNV